jgi:protein-S-isoprenylcysteine O-methyltransferase Ste14
MMNGTGFPWILLACALYGVVHSLLAALWVKNRARRALGGAAYARFYRLFFSIMGGVTFLPILALVALLPDRPIYAVPAPWSVLMVVLQAAAVAGIAVGVLQTGAMRFVGIQQVFRPAAQEASETLITGGLYRLVRHPLYTFSMLFLWLTPVMTWNILALNLGLTAYMLAGSIFEEHKLVEQFGQAYLDYRRRTPRIIPGIKPRG